MKWLRNIICLPIHLYQWTLSPIKRLIMGPNAGCRFQPTCSNYAIQAIQNLGIIRGCMLALKRILRCHPWGGQGWDPVPKKDQTSSDHSIVDRQDRSLSSWTPTVPAMAGNKQK